MACDFTFSTRDDGTGKQVTYARLFIDEFNAAEAPIDTFRKGTLLDKSQKYFLEEGYKAWLANPPEADVEPAVEVAAEALPEAPIVVDETLVADPLSVETPIVVVPDTPADAPAA